MSDRERNIMENKEYTVTGRIHGWRAVLIKANSASEAIKLARKLSATEWIIGDLYISNDLSARQSHKAHEIVKEKLKRIVIEKLLDKDRENPAPAAKP